MEIIDVLPDINITDKKMEKKKKAQEWLKQRSNIHKTFQTVLGVSIILTSIYI